MTPFIEIVNLFTKYYILMCILHEPMLKMFHTYIPDYIMCAIKSYNFYKYETTCVQRTLRTYGVPITTMDQLKSQDG